MLKILILLNSDLNIDKQFKKLKSVPISYMQFISFFHPMLGKSKRLCNS